MKAHVTIAAMLGLLFNITPVCSAQTTNEAQIKDVIISIQEQITDPTAELEPLPISCDLKCYEEGHRVLAEATFSNTTYLTFPVFNGALSKERDTEGTCFQVSLNKQHIPYEGIYVKRPAPGADEFYTMKPHEALVARVEISKYFDFSKAGEYEITYSCIANGWPPGGTNLLKIVSSPVRLTKQ